MQRYGQYGECVGKIIYFNNKGESSINLADRKEKIPYKNNLKISGQQHNHHPATNTTLF